MDADSVRNSEAEIKPPFIRSPYNYDMSVASVESSMVDNGEPSPTVQSEKDNTDINVIVKRFGVTGTIPSNPRLPLPDDYVGVTDYHSALNAVKDAERAFMEIPAEIRARFDNDPQKFAEFCLDENNLEEMDKMGLTNESVKEKLRERAEADNIREREENELREQRVPIIEEYDDGGVKRRADSRAEASRGSADSAQRNVGATGVRSQK